MADGARGTRDRGHLRLAATDAEDESRHLVSLRRRLDDVTRLVSDWVWETDAEFAFTSVSARVVKALGYQPLEMAGRTFERFCEAGDAEAVLVKLRGRSPFRDVACAIVGADGGRRQFLISGVPVFDDDSGDFVGFRGTAEDVTERRAAVEALHRREAVLQAVSGAAGAFLAAADWQAEMPAAIAALGEAAQADRVRVFEVETVGDGRHVGRCRFHWQAGGDAEDLAGEAAGRAHALGAWERRLAAGEVVATVIASLPRAQRWLLAADGVGSVLAVPVFAGGTWWGFIRFDRAADGEPWQDAEVDAVRAAAGIIGGAIHRQACERTGRESEARVATAFQTSPDAIAMTRLADGAMLEVNDGFVQITGRGRDETVGRCVRELGLVADRTALFGVLRALLRDGEVRDSEVRFRDAAGEERYGSLSARITELDGEPCVLSVTRDTTARRRSGETLRKLSQAVEQSPVLVMITDTAGVVEYVNPKFVEITGYARDEIVGKTPAVFKSGHTADEEYAQMWAAITAGREWRGEFYNKKKNGQYFWAAQSISPIRAADGTITHFVSVSEDITARRFYEERLRHQTYHDSLTDLPNRTLFFDRLPRALARARRDGRALTLMFIDLDRFRFVNDSVGHDGGDEVLRQVALRLASRVGPTDTVARLASDEFSVVVAEGGDRRQAAALVPEILASLAEPFVVGANEVELHASIGIAVFPEDGADEYSLLKNADTAMQRAKELGGNTHQFFAPGMNARAMTYITLGRDLRQAQSRDQFELFYQPVVDIPSGAVVGAESLIRWRHPEFGLIPPDRFIALAEDSGLIEPIGEWVLRESCRQNRLWRDEGLGPLRIAVNVSSRQFKRGRLVGSVFAALSDYDLAPANLAVEITESAFLADVEEINAILGKLNGMGVAISVDDFGTGYSSLSYLRRLPLSTLKVDRMFVHDVAANPDAAAITDAIIAMAHRLHLSVVAEGVDNEAQLEFLRAKGCEMMQGFFFSPPISAAEFTEMLRKGRRLAGPPDLFTVQPERG